MKYIYRYSWEDKCFIEVGTQFVDGCKHYYPTLLRFPYVVK